MVSESTATTDYLPGLFIYSSVRTTQNSDFNYDSDLIPYDSRFNRNYDELVSERIDNTFGNYNDVFDLIKHNLYSISDQEPILSEIKENEFEHKYRFSQFSTITDILKNTISEFYQHKIKVEHEFENNKEKYEKFSKNILETISDINVISGTLSEEDISFKNILIERINWYYLKLNLENLKKQSNDLNTEFLYIKKFMIQLSGVTNNIVCQICQENQITHFIDPCGHTLCEKCKDRSDRMTKCHFCRVKSNSFKKLYL